MLELLTGLGLLELWHLIYSRLLTEFGILVFFTNLSLMEFQELKSYGMSGQIFGLISSFLSTRRIGVVLNGKFHRNIQLMLEFLKAPVLQGSKVLHFSYYALIIFLLMLSVILLSMLMILLSIQSVIRHLICCNNLNWLLNLYLIYKSLWTGVRSGLLISMLGKPSWFRLTGLITIVLLM